MEESGQTSGMVGRGGGGGVIPGELEVLRSTLL